ncbi:alpha-1,3-mannosyl-glycoprotein 2-beta-N-acetylglucosaminyltransferase-like [Stylophora pistillata]|nr:alpha-1,3-mannosyl-glycoprotein 2-beta-N-acetylglucosaminyltransferase-like [Stylophora pistillata]
MYRPVKHGNIDHSRYTIYERFENRKTNLPKRFSAATNAQGIVATVLVIACNRPEVERCLDRLLRFRPSEKKFPIVVSQDCGHEETAKVIASYGDKVMYVRHPDVSDINVPGGADNLKGYYKLSRHYRWALSRVFDVLHQDTVIIVEDDLEIAPDFFEYFEATKTLLDKDPTVWCVSAWNDNGKTGRVRGNDLLYRTDFFPGLGWMLKKSLWEELAPKWPAAFWDDWMRHPEQRRDRACIRPEIPRVVTFGRIGVSRGQFFDEHLKYIKLNDEFYPFTEKNLTYLMKDVYDAAFINTVYKSPLVSFEYFHSGQVMPAPSVRVQYESEETFRSLANQLEIMNDFKAGVPRMAYRGVVSFMYKNLRVYLTPPRNWSGYEYPE